MSSTTSEPRLNLPMRRFLLDAQSPLAPHEWKTLCPSGRDAPAPVELVIKL